MHDLPAKPSAVRVDAAHPEYQPQADAETVSRRERESEVGASDKVGLVIPKSNLMSQEGYK
jgi:hypothetical protein